MQAPESRMKGKKQTLVAMVLCTILPPPNIYYPCLLSCTLLPLAICSSPKICLLCFFLLSNHGHISPAHHSLCSSSPLNTLRTNRPHRPLISLPLSIRLIPTSAFLHQLPLLQRALPLTTSQPGRTLIFLRRPLDPTLTISLLPSDRKSVV